MGPGFFRLKDKMAGFFRPKEGFGARCLSGSGKAQRRRRKNTRINTQKSDFSLKNRIRQHRKPFFFAPAAGYKRDKYFVSTVMISIQDFLCRSFCGSLQKDAETQRMRLCRNGRNSDGPSDITVTCYNGSNSLLILSIRPISACTRQS